MRRIAALLFVFLFAAPLFAQEGSATLTGFVQDSAKAFVPGAKVLVIKTDTDTQFAATTDKDGSYTISSLPVGPYRIQVEKLGFKTILKEDLSLHTQDALQINFQMAVGSTSESVTVEGGAMTNSSPAVSMTVDREFVENMPLNGRSFQDLIQLAPGTVAGGNGGGNNAGYYSIDGQRADSNNYTVDGVSANLGGFLIQEEGTTAAGLSGSAPLGTVLATTQSLASVDSLQEFTIQTSGYTAEYGRNPGGQIQFTTRSGTNGIHGSLFEFLRNTIFDANSFSNDYNNRPQTAEHQNDFGGTIGGPVIVPKLYNGKDKTFFFASYEGLRLLLPSSETEYNTTAAFRNAASPNVQPFLNAAPLPNTSIAGDSCTVSGTTINVSGSAGPGATPCDEEFYYGYSYPNNVDNYSLRIDQNLGKRLHAFVRYADTPSSTVLKVEEPETETVNTHLWTAGLTMNLASNLLDDLRFNFSHDGEGTIEVLRSIDGSVPWAQNLLAPAAYANNPYNELYPIVRIPSTEVEVEDAINGSGTVQHQYQIVDSLTWTRGKQSIKFGVDWRRLTPKEIGQTYNSDVDIESVTAIQQGFATSVQITATEPGTPVLDDLSLYAQDHWKISSRLSVDYGLRWEFAPPPGPSHGSYPVTLTSRDLATASITHGDTQPYKTDYHSFAPRFGFAWNAILSQSHPLTVRGGFGIFFDTGQSTATNSYFDGYPFSVTGPTQTNVPLPLSSAVLTPPSLNFPLTPPYPFIFVSDPGLTMPYTEQWDLSIDERLNVKNTLTASYVGNNGRKLLFSQQYNSFPENPDFTELLYTYNGAQSNYNALQVQDVGRVANGLDFVGSFTWAHALDNASTDQSDLAPIYGNSSYDLRRVLNFALNYQTPTVSWSHWMESVTHGWMLANRFSTQSGLPFGIAQATVYLPDGAKTSYSPDLVPGVPIYLHGSAAGKVPASWRLNRAAFACVPTNTGQECSGTPLYNGNLGRNYLREPSFWAWNTALQRSFPIYEGLNLNFRAEAFNILNHPNLYGPSASLTASTFGELINGDITTIGAGNSLYAMGAARSLQLSLHLQF